VKRALLSYRSMRYLSIAVICLISFLLAGLGAAQSVPYARSYGKSREEVDKALKDLQAYIGQKLPIVDGFVAAGDIPLERFERAYYQFSIDLVPGNSGGTIVRLTAKITAWYADKDPAKSGYQVIPSNGRLELDLLDRLDERLGGKPAPLAAHSLSNPRISGPKAKLDLGSVSLAAPSKEQSSVGEGQTGEIASLRAKREAEEKRMLELNEELQSLQEIKKNQAHPLNLVAVRKSGTPVMAKPAEGSRLLLFNASADDEFEFIEATGEWIHVQISGPSRGYIRRSNLDLPEFIAARLKSPNGAASEEKQASFRIGREENSPFPGDWEPLKGKMVKIYTVQPVSQDPKETDARAKLAFAGGLLRKYAAETTSSTPALDGIVVIFDAADGGIIGSTLLNVQQLASGSLSLDSFWKHCYIDPPDAFQLSSNP
jgi:hypothetical protein